MLASMLHILSATNVRAYLSKSDSEIMNTLRTFTLPFGKELLFGHLINSLYEAISELKDFEGQALIRFES